MPAWLIFEFAVLAAAARLAWQCGWRRNAGTTPAEALLAVLSLDVILGSLAPAAISFARLNSPAAYMGLSALLLAAAGIRPREARRAALELGSMFQELASGSRPVLWAVGMVLCVPLLLLALRPIEEVDSLNYLHYLLEWSANRSTPYHFMFNYVAFWELSFLPGLVLTRSDLYFGLTALKPLALLGLGVWLTGLELGLPRRLAAVVTAGLLSFRHLWWEHSGVATLKNDALHGAGFVLMTLALARAATRRDRVADHALMAFGITFACVKFSGPVLAAATLAAFWLLRRPGFRIALGTLLPALACCGHYYLRNLLVYGSPVYPYQVSIAGWRLPGTGDLSHTTILSSLGDVRLWRAFLFPSGGLSPAGVWFPAVLVAALAFGFWFSARGAVAWARRRTRPDPMAWVGAFLLLGWAVYFRTYYSASSSPGDLAHILNDLVSLRYAEGVLAVSEVFLAALLCSAIGPAVPLALAAIQLASRLWLLYRHLPLDVFPIAAVAASCALLAAALAIVLAVAPPRRRAAALALVTGVPLIAAAPWITERNRRHWADWWKEIHAPFREAAPSSIFLIEDPRGGYAAGHFLLAGRQFQHEVQVGTEADFARSRARYAVRWVYPNEPVPDLDAFAARHSSRAYEPIIRTAYGVVLERMRRVPAPALAEAWLLPEGRLPAPGAEVDEGSAAPKLRRIRTGEAVLTPAGRLLAVDASETRLLSPADGARLRLLNCGPLDAAGAPLGLDCVYTMGSWRVVIPEGARLNRDPEFRQARLSHSLGVRFVSVSEGRGSAEYGPDWIRVQAHNRTRWLALVEHFPDLPDRFPLTIRARLRCPGPRPCRLSYVGASAVERVAQPGEEWQTLTLLLRRVASAGDYFAVGKAESEAGEAFEIRELSLLAGFFPL